MAVRGRQEKWGESREYVKKQRSEGCGEGGGGGGRNGRLSSVGFDFDVCAEPQRGATVRGANRMRKAGESGATGLVLVLCVDVSR